MNNGPPVEMRIDTGCTRRGDLVQKTCIKNRQRQATVANGEIVSNKLADVTIQIQGRTLQVEAAVSNDLPVPVLLGTDLLLEEMIIESSAPETLQKYSKTLEDESFAVVTRGQERYEQQKEEKQMSQEKAAQGVAKPLLMTESEKASRGVAKPLLTTESEKAARGVAKPLLTTESEKAARGVAKPLLMTESEKAAQGVAKPL